MPAAPARRSLTRRALAAAVAALVLAIAILSMETAYATWQDQAGTDLGTVSTGTAELTADWSPGSEAATWQNLLPGDTATRTLTVTNIGDVPLALYAGVPISPVGAELRIADGRKAAGTPPLSATAQPLRASGAPLVLAPGQTASMQVMLTITPGMATDQRLELTLELEGRQVA